MTQQSAILLYLRNLDGWILAGKIRNFRTPEGHWIGFRGDRDVRQLVEDGLLEREYRGKFAWVRAKPIDSVVQRIPPSKEKQKEIRDYDRALVDRINQISPRKEIKKVEAGRLF